MTIEERLQRLERMAAIATLGAAVDGSMDSVAAFRVARDGAVNDAVCIMQEIKDRQG